MTSFEEIKKQLEKYNVSTPCIGENIDGETVVIESGNDEEGCFFVVQTLQRNNWCRINSYYENGTMTETYMK